MSNLNTWGENVKMNASIFLDRDGVVVEEINYLSSVEDVVLMEGAGDAISKLKEAGFIVIVITNQSGVARGYFSEEKVQEINDYIKRELGKRGGRIDKFYYCPHHPSFGRGKYRKECNCRKPKIGMIEEAVRDFNIDLQKSYLIGDKLSDIKAGLTAGCKSILVGTGHGKTQNSINYEEDELFMGILNDINAAAVYILKDLVRDDRMHIGGN